ncbi:MAG: ATP-binding protein [Prevotella sp.]|nr:ATP-binding protein [Prevotella sp.]
METKRLKRLPVGIQTFEKIRENDMLYIDKTEYIWNMINLGNYIFLSRPRRFGKSLLVSTLQAYFEGRKDLFKGLFIETVEKEWTEYPVLRFDMSTAKHCNKEELLLELSNKLTRYEAIYGKGAADEVKPNQRFQGLIERAHEKTGKKVVILIDEYDAPLLDVVHKDEELESLRQVMRNFYSPLKYCDPHLQFLFLTGITKFSQLSIFSELNNLKNISMRPDYAGVCGITTEEMLTAMSDYVDDFAEAQEITCEEAIEGLKRQYDGYHFTWPSPDVFNPFSLLNAFQDHDYTNYWFGSGTPTYLIEMLRKFNVVPSKIGGASVLASAFDAPTENMMSITPLLYQSGYITIKDYNRVAKLYTLDIPNTEIRVGLMDSLLPNYVERRKEAGNTTIAKMYLALLNDNLDEVFRLLQSYLLTVPYCNNANSEGHYQQLLYVIFSLFGRYVEVEVRTPTGRVDIVMKTAKVVYVFELKLNMSAQSAINQIDLKDYSSKFALSGLPIVKVGINFDPERRTIGDWKVCAHV